MQFTDSPKNWSKHSLPTHPDWLIKAFLSITSSTYLSSFKRTCLFSIFQRQHLIKHNRKLILQTHLMYDSIKQISVPCYLKMFIKYISQTFHKSMYNIMFNRLRIHVYVLTTNNNNVQLAINRFKFNIWPHDCVDKCLDHKLQNPNQFARYYLLCVATATLPATFHTTNVCLVSIHTYTHTRKAIKLLQSSNVTTLWTVFQEKEK